MLKKSVEDYIKKYTPQFYALFNAQEDKKLCLIHFYYYGYLGVIV